MLLQMGRLRERVVAGLILCVSAAVGSAVDSPPVESDVLTYSVAPNGQLVALADEQGSIWIWEIESDKLVPLFRAPNEHSGANKFRQLRFSADSRRLATSDVGNGTVKIWKRFETESEVTWRETDSVDVATQNEAYHIVAEFLPDGGLVVGCGRFVDADMDERRFILLRYEYRDGQRLKREVASFGELVYDAALTRAKGENDILLVSLWSGLIAIDLSTGRTRYKIPVPPGSIDVSRDGNFGAIVYLERFLVPDDYGILMWDLPTGKPIQQLHNQTFGRRAAFTSDCGSLAFLVADSNAVGRWDLRIQRVLPQVLLPEEFEELVLFADDSVMAVKRIDRNHRIRLHSVDLDSLRPPRPRYPLPDVPTQ